MDSLYTLSSPALYCTVLRCAVLSCLLNAIHSLFDRREEKSAINVTESRQNYIIALSLLSMTITLQHESNLAFECDTVIYKSVLHCTVLYSTT